MRSFLCLLIALIILAGGSPVPELTPTPPPPTPTLQERETLRQDFDLAFKEAAPQHSQFRVQWATDDKNSFIWVANKEKVRYKLGDCSPGIETSHPFTKCVKASLPNTTSHTMYDAFAICSYRTGLQTDLLPIGTVPPGNIATWEWSYLPGRESATDYLCTLGWLPHPDAQ